MPLIKNGQLAEDHWVPVADGEAAPEEGDIIISLERWQAERDTLIARPFRLGVRLRADQSPRLIADDLGQFDLIALEFPSFRDGRAYSHARVLRQHYGFTGELRAVGEVLRDQLLFMARCGFNAFEVAEDLTPESWRTALSEFSVFYQSAADSRLSAYEMRQACTAAAE